MRTATTALLALALPVLLAPASAAQLPELPDEDVPRQASLPPPSPAADADSRAAGQPQATFGDTLDVALSFHVVRVLRDDGAPVLGLVAADFRAIGEGGDPLPVVAVDWYDSGATVDRWQTPPRFSAPDLDELPPSPTATAPAGARLADLPGKLEPNPRTAVRYDFRLGTLVVTNAGMSSTP